MTTCLLGLGSNLGDPRDNLNAAVAHLRSTPGVEVTKVSTWIMTDPVGGPSGQQAFLNGAVRLESELTAVDLLRTMQNVERLMGRFREMRWGPRLIDLDLLLYGDQVVDLPGCSVPHPWLAIRRFVLEPAAEVAPDMNHPLIGRSIGQLMMHLVQAKPVLSLVSADPSLASYFAKELANRLSLPSICQGQAASDDDSAGDEEPVGSTGSAQTDQIESDYTAVSANSTQWSVRNGWPAYYGAVDKINLLENTQTSTPKLVVVLHRPEFDSDAVARHQELLTQVQASARPWLELSASDTERVVHDLRAAMSTMQ